MRQEGVDVRIFLDQFVGRLAAAMTGAGLDPNQVRRIAGIQSLQPRGIFEAMAGYHPIIGIGGGDDQRRIIDAISDIVIGRIAKQGFESCSLFG